MEICYDLKTGERFLESDPTECILVGNGPSNKVLQQLDFERPIPVFRVNKFFGKNQPRPELCSGVFYSTPSVNFLLELSGWVQRGGNVGKIFTPRIKEALEAGIPECQLFDFWREVASSPPHAYFFMRRPLPTITIQALFCLENRGYRQITLIGYDQFINEKSGLKDWLSSKFMRFRGRNYRKGHDIDVDTEGLAFCDNRLKQLRCYSNNQNVLKILRAPKSSENLSEVNTIKRQSLKKRTTTAKASFAYVTLCVDGFWPGTLGLYYSLVRSKVSHPLLCLYSDENDIVELKKRGLPRLKFKKIQKINNPYAGQSRFQVSLNKLHAFNLSQYQKVLFLDSDCIVRTSLDHLFSTNTRFAACRDFGHKPSAGFNSGVMLIEPDAELFDSMTKLIDKIPSSDGGDQGFLNQIFHMDQVTLLSDDYNYLISRDLRSRTDISNAFILHYSGADKPWNQPSRSLIENRGRKEFFEVFPTEEALAIWDNRDRQLAAKNLVGRAIRALLVTKTVLRWLKYEF